MNFYDWFFREIENGEQRAPAGLFSWQHLLAVTLTLAILLTIAVFLGKKFRNDPKKQNIVLLVAGISIVALQLMKRIYLLAETDNVIDCLIGNMPLYFCDIMIFIIPVCAIVRGRAKEICLDFIAICGLLMGFMGNYFAGNLYPSHAIISFSVFNALLNHSISAFTSLFIWVAGMNKMEKKNIPFTIGILFAFMTVALIVDYVNIPINGNPRNFMFFFHGDGTPFTFFHDMVGGNKIIYQIIVYTLQCGYMGLFYLVYYWVAKLATNKKTQKESAQENA